MNKILHVKLNNDNKISFSLDYRASATTILE